MKCEFGVCPKQDADYIEQSLRLYGIVTKKLCHEGAIFIQNNLESDKITTENQHSGYHQNSHHGFDMEVCF